MHILTSPLYQAGALSELPRVVLALSRLSLLSFSPKCAATTGCWCWLGVIGETEKILLVAPSLLKGKAPLQTVHKDFTSKALVFEKSYVRMKYNELKEKNRETHHPADIDRSTRPLPRSRSTSRGVALSQVEGKLGRAHMPLSMGRGTAVGSTKDNLQPQLTPPSHNKAVCRSVETQTQERGEKVVRGRQTLFLRLFIRRGRL